MSEFLASSVEYIKGIGPVKGELLRNELNIHSFRDMLYWFPYRYVDRTRFYKISEINEELPYVLVKGKITTITAHGQKRATRLTAQLRDETGSIELIWFQAIKWMRDSLKTAQEYIVFGKPTRYVGKLNIIHPEIETPEYNSEATYLTPFYNTTEKCKANGLDSKSISRSMKALIEKFQKELLPETLPQWLKQKYQLIDLKQAIINIHFPADNELLRAAKRRLKFEELFYLQLHLLGLKKVRQERIKGIVFEKVGEHFNSFYHHHLPFQLTKAQKRVIREIRTDTFTGRQMNRLLQGDVGSGKTVVALMAMLLAIDNRCQSCLMAPTEILANQHYETITSLIRDLPVKVSLLTGSTKSVQRKKILESLADGSLHILIGTHALIEETVRFRQLGLAVIDEQHRFGVEQRARLWLNEQVKPHVLVMTATPIPRTLAMTVYGDLDVSVIDELPPGRKPVATYHFREDKRLKLIGFIRSQVKEGRQVYIVYPLIDESEKLDYANLVQGYESLERDFPPPDYKVSIVHGRQKSELRQLEMRLFAEGKTHIMVATTVIEVGVNIPNASVMVIESAERFGLSQLHQLRGRVGRGASQSYCILMTGNKLSADARERIKVMTQTNDGFVIAEADMRLRGPGDILGTQQSGMVDFKIADLTTDSLLIEETRDAANELLNLDRTLSLPENALIRQQVIRHRKEKGEWDKVS
ncbi:MAG: ATP-dependent DNA helicase RecG [Bacteroidia bacterium]|nr:ATP-dependent DNA helicase RecG [Bacteroidia bacterium]